MKKIPYDGYKVEERNKTKRRKKDWEEKNGTR